MAEFRFALATQPLRGTIRVPADKSITHRALMLGPLAEGDVRIENFLDSKTTRATLHCMRALGAEIDQHDTNTLVIRGRGLHSLSQPSDVLFCEGSGTTMRLLAGLCAGQPFETTLDGTPALCARPMARVVEPLRAMGATVTASQGDRFPPLNLRGGNLHGIDYTLPVASAQVKSAILLAGLFADSPTIVREPAPSRDHTERMLHAFGVQVTSHKSQVGGDTSGVIQLSPPSALRPATCNVRPAADFSSAAFFIVAALLVRHSEICLEGVGLNPTRTGLLDALTRMTARAQKDALIKIENRREVNGEPVGDLIVRASDGLQGVEMGGEMVPRMIDEFPIFAIAATQAGGETRVRDAAELRVKESDRIATLTTELRKLGAQVEPQDDGFIIAGPTQLRGTRVNSHGDHRLAMSLAVAGFIADGETTIENWECVADSFPNFGEFMFQAIGRKPSN